LVDNSIIGLIEPCGGSNILGKLNGTSYYIIWREENFGDDFFITAMSAEGDMIYVSSNNGDGTILGIKSWNATNGNQVWSTGIVFSPTNYIPSVMVPVGDGSNIMFFGPIIYQFSECNDEGVCIAPGSGCDCNENYYTSDCLVFCNVSECGQKTHGNGGCSNDTGICECFENYYNSDCSVFCDNDVCSQEGHASCNSQGTCSCDSQYYGSTCNTFCDPEKTCNSNGICKEDGSCDCMTTYAGSTCSSRSTSVIVGAVFGALIGVVLIGGLFYCWRRSKRRQYEEIDKNEK